MSKSYFVSLECSNRELVSKFIPGAEGYGIEGVMGLSDRLTCDISSVNAVGKIGACLHSLGIEDLKVEDRFNKKFFPHLDDKYCFGEAVEEAFVLSPENAYAENTFMLRRINVLDLDNELACQIAVCESPSSNPFESMFQESDKHFTKESVSSSFVLN